LRLDAVDTVGGGSEREDRHVAGQGNRDSHDGSARHDSIERGREIGGGLPHVG
jgi:hypothetical protein